MIISAGDHDRTHQVAMQRDFSRYDIFVVLIETLDGDVT